MPNRYLQPFVGTPYEHDQVKLLGIRGFYEDLGDPHKNDLGIYDDLIVRCIGEETVGFRASVDPGWFWIKNPMNPGGCAMLPEGTFSFELGLHDDQYPALVPTGSFKVWRLDKEGKIARTGTSTTVHIHSGGPGVNVDKYSAGCQVIQSPEGYFGATWQKFFEPLAQAMHLAKQATVAYRLLKLADLP